MGIMLYTRGKAAAGVAPFKVYSYKTGAWNEILEKVPFGVCKRSAAVTQAASFEHDSLRFYVQVLFFQI